MPRLIRVTRITHITKVECYSFLTQVAKVLLRFIQKYFLNLHTIIYFMLYALFFSKIIYCITIKCPKIIALKFYVTNHTLKMDIIKECNYCSITINYLEKF